MSDPSQLNGWHRIAYLLGERWPEWEPSIQERADWKRMIGGCVVEWIDEAMLRVKQSYSSKIPQVKWILGKYYEVKQEHFDRVNAVQVSEQSETKANEMREVEYDRKQCLQYLKQIAPEILLAARDAVRRDGGGFITGGGSDEVERWSWMFRFAVMFRLQDRPEEFGLDGCSDQPLLSQ